MGKFPISGNIIIANQTFHTNAKVANWLDTGWNAKSTFCIPTDTERNPPCKPMAGGQAPYDSKFTSVQRYSLRPSLRRYGDNPPLEAARAVIRQFVVHHDGCASSDMCFNVLHNERGLSCHFLIDNDGTIYQTLDLALAAWHAAEWNVASIGVELCNYGDANAQPTYYSSGRHGKNRDKIPIKINGHKILSYGYTEEQMTEFGKLVLELRRLLPNIPLEYPQSSPGVQSWETLPQAASFGFAGYISHYHLTQQKWDPGPFDFKKFLSELRGQFCLPIFWRDQKPDEDKPVVPPAREDLQAASKKLYDMNEQRAEGGYFPVGPWGDSRLWHGGIHLAGKPKQPVFAPFPGRIVAARMGADSPIGSTNFVLLRHDLSLGQQKVQFFSLFMHIADGTKAPADKPIDWMTTDGWKKNYKPGDVVLLDEPVLAGALLGHMGNAGPGDNNKAQLHIEFFSTGDLFADMNNTLWEVIDGTAGGRFCEVPRINDLIDSNKNGLLERGELKTFYENGGGAQARNFVTFHVSEWTFEPSWSEQLKLPADFKNVKAEDIDAMVAEQITPGLWWNQKVAAHAKLPIDGVVYHYNPITFVQWFNQELIESAALEEKTKVVLDAKDTSKVPSGITDDFGDKDGTSMRSAIDLSDDPCNKSLTLDQLVLGYDNPDCAP
ncbi:MAG: N-acetylmuramoyl-L-alanine amidase [Kofleriaceae bacterium]